jgi:ABC-2 type transport system permease protein
VVALSFGLSGLLAGNSGANLAYLIAQGRLDYYLVFPRVLLTHVIFSRMSVSGIGEVSFGLLAFAFAGLFRPLDVLFFLAASIPAALIYMAFTVIAGSLAFFMGNAQYASQQMTNSILTFALYPNTLFSGAARFLLFTLVPAAFIGGVPVEIIKGHNGQLLAMLCGVAVVMWTIAIALFYQGLHRYESGSAINVNV